jgi:hypothetical protein
MLNTVNLVPAPQSLSTSAPLFAYLNGTRNEWRLSGNAPRRLLLVTTNHVGNNLFCTPGIRLLKRHLPDVTLDVVAMSSRGVRVFDNNPDIRKVYLVKSKMWVRWLAATYDGVIGLQHEVATRYLGSSCKNCMIIGPPLPLVHHAEGVLQFDPSNPHRLS